MRGFQGYFPDNGAFTINGRPMKPFEDYALRFTAKKCAAGVEPVLPTPLSARFHFLALEAIGGVYHIALRF